MRIEPGHVLHDRWRIEAELGAGGMGYVLVGQDLFLKRRVAIKSLHPHLAAVEQVHARFLTEAQVMARIDAPEVVSVYDAFDWSGLPVVVMEYVEGEPLSRLLARDPRPSQGFVRSVMEGVLKGLRAAHEAGVVHRDVKPDNIMVLSGRDGEVGVRLLDFGVAQVHEELRHTRTGSVVGTVRYMSPEQVKDSSRVDARTDLFSAGVVLWEMLSGAEPWSHAENDFDLRIAVVREPLPALGAEVPADLVELVSWLTCKDASGRPPDASSALRRLREGSALGSGSGSGAGTGSGSGSGPGSGTGSGSRVPVAAASFAPSGIGERTKGETETPAVGTVGRSRGPAVLWFALGSLFLLFVVVHQVSSCRAESARAEAARVEAERAEAARAEAARVEAERAEAARVEAARVEAARVEAERAEAARAEAARAEAARAEAARAEAARLTGPMLRVRAGSFRMGSPAGEEGRDSWREAQVEVRLTRDYFLGRYPVTQGEYQAVVGGNPSQFSQCGARCPVEGVSWYDAVRFTNRLNERQGLPSCYDNEGRVVGGATVYACAGYRLPTEAEWEYAARAGTTGARYGALDAVAWHAGNSGRRTHPVGGKQANAWGFHDMLGNVWEWTATWYRAAHSGGTDPVGPSSGSFRVLRGGSWDGDASFARAAGRDFSAPVFRFINFGFRLARSAP